MTSIIPFISNEVFEPSDIKVMSVAYNKAIEDIYDFGHPNKIVEKLIASCIITLTKRGERNPDHLRERAMAACGFSRLRQTAGARGLLGGAAACSS